LFWTKSDPDNVSMEAKHMNFSVITVCYQAKDVLAETMDSVLTQSIDNLEYVIVDGGSTDGTQALVATYSDARIRFVSEYDKGIYDAMNKGVQLCHGEYVIFMNAGDRFVDKRVLESIENQLKKKRPDIIYGDYYEVVSGRKKLVDYSGITPNSWFFLMSKMICHQAIVANREWLLNFPFDLRYRYAADRQWLIRCVKAGAVLQHVPVPIALYDRGGVSSDLGNFEKVRQEIDLCLVEQYPKRGALLQRIKKNKKLREWIRCLIFKK